MRSLYIVMIDGTYKIKPQKAISARHSRAILQNMWNSS